MTTPVEKTADSHIAKMAGTHIEQSPETGSENDMGSGKDQLDRERAQQLAQHYVPDTAEEKAIVRKLDWRLVPTCWILYLMGNIDRANVGNAKTGGMGADFGLTSNQYSVVVLIFFVSYMVFEIPSNMILNRVRPSIYLPGLAILWGTIATCMGAVQNTQQLTVLRFLLGIAEAGFAPGCTFYLSSWYKKTELGTRFAFLYTSVAIAGAISGLLAGVITEYMDGAAGIRGWRWLFILEGIASVVVGIAVHFIMPDYPTSSKSKFLNEEERLIACNRLALEGIGLTQGAHVKISEWAAFKLTVADWRTWSLCLLFVLGTGSQTIQYFIPSLVQSFGWTGNKAQYLTIPAYAFAVVCIIGGCFVADRIKSIPPVLAAMSGTGFVFFVGVTCVGNGTVRYVLTIIAFGTIYGCSPLAKTWIATTLSHPAEKRAIAIALINALGNGSSIYGSFLWPDSDGPRYLIGFGTTTAWMGTLSVMTVVFAYLFKKFPAKNLDHTAVMASQIRAEREVQQSKTLA